MLLHDLILPHARSLQNQIAIRKDDDSLTYQDLLLAVQTAASGMNRLGLQRGERVGIYLNKRFETVISYFAVTYVGAIFVPINPLLKPAQVSHILQDCSVSMLITTAYQAETLSDAIASCTSLSNVVTIDTRDEQNAPPGLAPTADWKNVMRSDAPMEQCAKRIETDIAAILYTSGSTGKPKGVVLSHRNMVAGALSVAKYLENTPSDVLLAALPFSFDAGFSQLTTAFSVGASVVLLDYLVPADVIRVAGKHQVTGLAGVPPLWAQLCRLDWPEESTSSLRYVTNTGGVMPAAVLTSLRRRIPETNVFLMYGLTESFRSTYLPPNELDARPNSIGKAIPNAEILVINEDGSPCESGQPGELVHRGPLVSLGYWNDPERTAIRFRPAPNLPSELPLTEVAVWSGDIVVKDNDDFLYFVGRKDDMIKSSGYRISPTEIEELFYESGLVSECAAIGVPHQSLGQAIVVVCYTDGDSDTLLSQLNSICRKELPNYMQPKEIRFQGSLPRNPNGKIDRKKLSLELRHLFQGID